MVLRIFWHVAAFIFCILGLGYIFYAILKARRKRMKVKIDTGIIVSVVSIIIGILGNLYPPEQIIKNNSIDDSQNLNMPKIPVTTEVEPNNELSSANLISVNNDINGVLDPQNDIDFYYFTISQKSSIIFSFIHDKIDSNDTNWVLTLLDNSDVEIMQYNVLGNKARSSFDKLRLPAGTYYIKVDSYHHINVPYIFQIQSTPEDQNFETEPNNEITLANKNNTIQLNTKICGNLQTNNDIDYYHFTVTQAGILSVTFQHEFIDSNDSFWRISILGDDSEPITSSNIQGNESKVETDKVRLSPAESGSTSHYYLKIEKYYDYNPADYNFTINFTPEAQLETSESGFYRYDKEPNNEPSNATRIEVNTLIDGNMQSRNDIDYFEFTIPSDGMASILFEHDLIDSDYVYWEISLLAKENDSSLELPSFMSIGSETIIASDTVRIPAGTYYVKVKSPYYYNNAMYKLQINFT